MTNAPRPPRKPLTAFEMLLEEARKFDQKQKQKRAELERQKQSEEAESQVESDRK